MRIVCLGSGNVASHLAIAFKEAGMDVIQVWSRNLNHVTDLAGTIGAEPIDNLKLVDSTADLYVIAVKDDAIVNIASALPDINGVVVHTSGSTPIGLLSRFSHHGVFYPLQTFSKNKHLELTGTPMCLEASSNLAYEIMEQASLAIGASVYQIDTIQRKTLHLAAVFACNFTNHLYHLANTILTENSLKFDMLRPLIMETALKVQEEMPVDVQTGPAVRHDDQTINRHLELLNPMPELQEIYETLSNSIKKTHL